MTDLEVVEAAVEAVLEKARKENPGYIPVPITGFTVMDWFQRALKEEKKKQKEKPDA